MQKVKIPKFPTSASEWFTQIVMERAARKSIDGKQHASLFAPCRHLQSMNFCLNMYFMREHGHYLVIK